MTALQDLDAWLLSEVRLEIDIGRRSFPPGDIDVYSALVEEVGELANALLEHKRGRKLAAAVRRECIQVAAMALQLCLQGDREIGLERQQPHVTLAISTVRVLDGVPTALSNMRAFAPDNVGALRRVVRYLGRVDDRVETILSSKGRMTIESLEVPCSHLAAAALRVAAEGDAAFPYAPEFPYRNDFATPSAAKAVDPSPTEAGGAAEFNEPHE